MAAPKTVKSRKTAKKPPTGRKKSSLRDLPTVKAGKVVGGYGGAEL